MTTTDTQPLSHSWRRGALGAALGAVLSPALGFGVGAVGSGIVWLVIGVVNRNSAGEFAEILPWSVIMGIMLAALSIPAGIVVGAAVSMTGRPLQSPWWRGAIGALAGFLIGGGGAMWLWSSDTDTSTAVVVTILLTISGALTGLIVPLLTRKALP